METLRVKRNDSIDWKPSPVIALATSLDESQVAAAREDGSVEIWLVSPGSVGWHCQLTIHGDPDSRISSLVWCRSSSESSSSSGRLLSSSIDGSISEWDLFDLKQKVILDSIGISIWQMAVEPVQDSPVSEYQHAYNGYENSKFTALDEEKSSESDDDVDSIELNLQPVLENPRLALGCDDGSVRLYAVSDSEGITYSRSFPGIKGEGDEPVRVLSVAWSLDAKQIFSGSSDGCIRCWDAKLAHELYRMTVGLGGVGGGPKPCVWSLLFLRSGTIVSADSTGSVQFWDTQHRTLLQTHTCHKGDVNALAAAPSHNKVFSAGSDGQVILYKFSSDTVGSGNEKSSAIPHRRWAYVGYVRAHTHDVRALTIAVPISREDDTPNEKVTRVRQRKKPIDFSYGKWAHLGVPMLISAGDDTKLFAYSVNEFTKFAPHDICPAPQRVPMQLVVNTILDGVSFLLVQYSNMLDILRVHVKSDANPKKVYGRNTNSQLLVRIKSKASRKIICSTIASMGMFLAYSDHVKPSMFELKFPEAEKGACVIKRKSLPRNLPYAHSMVFSVDSSRLMLAGHDRKIYVVDVESSELLHTFTPCRKVDDDNMPTEPPIIKMFTSSDGQWLAAVNCFGDIYVFNLEIQRQHWFISRLDGASVTAGGFPPSNSNVLIITTSSNQVYAFDVEAKQLGEWSRHHMFVLPRRFLEFPGEIVGLSFPPSSRSTSVIIYSARAMCLIDFGVPLEKENADSSLANVTDLSLIKSQNLLNHSGLKRKRKELGKNNIHKERKNFEFGAFEDPVLYVGHLSRDLLFVVEKPWKEVIQKFDAPVHKHIFGT